MQKIEAVKILRDLANGIDPYSGQSLAEESPYQHPKTIRALYAAIQALEQPQEKKQAKSAGTTIGKAWTKDSDSQLAADFDRGLTVTNLAHKYGRSPNAILTRLFRLGKIDTVTDRKA